MRQPQPPPASSRAGGAGTDVGDASELGETGEASEGSDVRVDTALEASIAAAAEAALDAPAEFEFSPESRVTLRARTIRRVPRSRLRLPRPSPSSPPGSTQPIGICALWRASQVANVCSFGFSARDVDRSRAAQNSALKSRLYWNMFPRSSAPGKPNVRYTSGGT